MIGGIDDSVLQAIARAGAPFDFCEPRGDARQRECSARHKASETLVP
jgi:hypothetical protein